MKIQKLRYILFAFIILFMISQAAFTKEKITIVLHPFEISGDFYDHDFSWVPVGFHDLLQSKFNQYYKENIRIVNRERTDMLLEEMKLSQAGLTNAEQAMEPGKFFAADFSIYGTIMCISPTNVLISSKIVDIKTSEQITITTTGNVERWSFEQGDSLVKKIFPELKRLRQQSFQKLANNTMTKISSAEKTTDNIHVISAKSMNATARFYKAISHIKNQEWLEAENELNRAIELDPDFERAYVNLGTVYMNLGQFHAAYEKYLEALRIYPTSEYALVNLGYFYTQQKQFDKSIQYFQKALEIVPNNCETMIELGKSYYERNDFMAAKNIFQEVLRIDSTYVSAHYFMGLIVVKEGEYQNAINSWQKVSINEEPFFRSFKHRAYKNLGFYWLTIQKNPAIAIQNYNMAKEFVQKYGTRDEFLEISLRLSQAFIENKEPEKAQPDLVKILELEPENPEIRFSYAIALFQNQHYDRCISELEVLLDMESAAQYHDRAKKILERLRGY